MTDPILQEIYDVRRKHWKEAGGTWEGLCAYYRKFSEEFERKGPDVMLRERLEARRKEREAQALAGGAMVVCEGEAPCYQTVERSNGQTVVRSNGDSDFARKGAEGDAV